MTDTVRGTVINLNAYGATVRLETGELASVSAPDLLQHRPDYERALTGRKFLTFERRATGARCIVLLAPQITDEQLDEQIATYLKETQEWEPPEGPSLHERHFLHKKKRAERFRPAR